MDSPDSNKESVLRFRKETLPAPLCWIFDGSRGVVLPVRIYFPNAYSSSRSFRIRLKISGTFCHSSIRCGELPERVERGSALANAIAWLDFKRVSLFAIVLLSVVFPQAFGPVTITHPDVCSFLSSAFSAIL